MTLSPEHEIRFDPQQGAGVEPLPKDLLAEIKDKLPPGAVFEVVGTEDLFNPHPYCISPRHVKFAAEHYSGILSGLAVEAAERQNVAMCDTCRQLIAKGQQNTKLTYAEHHHEKALMIAVPGNSTEELNDCPGLIKFLQDIKDIAEEMGITGFGFPIKK